MQLPLIRFSDNHQRLLFDLDKDLAEENDLAAQMPNKTDELEAALLAYLKEVDAD